MLLGFEAQDHDHLLKKWCAITFGMIDETCLALKQASNYFHGQNLYSFIIIVSTLTYELKIGKIEYQ